MNAKGIDAAYDRWAESYDRDRNLTRDLDRAVTRTRLASVRVGSLLEVGCGTGKNSAFYAEISAQLHAIDFSAAMLARAREKVQRENVRFELADATGALPAGDGTVDLVACNLVLEHIEELAPLFGEAARCLRQDGLLSISELHPFRQYLGGAARFERDGQSETIAAFVHHTSDFVCAAHGCGFRLSALEEWWHAEDQGKPPRLVTFLFAKRAP